MSNETNKFMNEQVEQGKAKYGNRRAARTRQPAEVNWPVAVDVTSVPESISRPQTFLNVR